MIYWLDEEAWGAEGSFKSSFFRNDENSNELNIYVINSELKECAEKCAEALNSLSRLEIKEICEKLIENVKKETANEEVDLQGVNNPFEILNYCWFITVYVDMASAEDEIAYVVEGEGQWGTPVGFVIRNGKVIYAGGDYLDYIKNK